VKFPGELLGAISDGRPYRDRNRITSCLPTADPGSSRLETDAGAGRWRRPAHGIRGVKSKYTADSFFVRFRPQRH
jgi:hypothetical protein